MTAFGQAEKELTSNDAAGARAFEPGVKNGPRIKKSRLAIV